MPRGANKQREKEYGELVGEFKKEGRYKGRQKEVAARIVNKQRAEYGETLDAKAKDRAGKSPDRDLPVKDYEGLTARQVARRLPDLSPPEVQKVRSYEEKHLNRKTVLEQIERHTARDTKSRN